jgi:hypothetical protein
VCDRTREHGRFDAEVAAHDFAAAEIAVREAVMAIESVDKPVKIEIQIVQDSPVAALLSASNSAVMVCIGALGGNRATGKRLGSTPAALAAYAHCPLAIVRQRGRHQTSSAWVVAEFNNTESTGARACRRRSPVAQRSTSGAGPAAKLQ